MKRPYSSVLLYLFLLVMFTLCGLVYRWGDADRICAVKADLHLKVPADCVRREFISPEDY